MKIGFLADLHLPRYWKEFKKAIERFQEKLDVLFFLGDLTDGNFNYIRKIYSIVKDKADKIYSIFGNNEFLDYREYLKKEFSFMNWIDDEVIEINRYKFFGTEGVLDKLTRWMERNEPEVWELWNKRLERIEEILKKEKDLIVLSHYAPVLETTSGDPCPWFWLGSKRFENLILKYKPKYVFHAHSHYSKVWFKEINGIKVYNVSFPIHKKVFVIEI